MTYITKTGNTGAPPLRSHETVTTAAPRGAQPLPGATGSLGALPVRDAKDASAFSTQGGTASLASSVLPHVMRTHHEVSRSLVDPSRLPEFDAAARRSLEAMGLPAHEVQGFFASTVSGSD